MSDLKIHEIAFHRNGVAGAQFYAIRFRSDDRELIATVFDAPHHVAVLAVDHLDTEGVGRLNAYRGDAFEPELRAAIREYHRRNDADEEAILAGREVEWPSGMVPKGTRVRLLVNKLPAHERGSYRVYDYYGQGEVGVVSSPHPNRQALSDWVLVEFDAKDGSGLKLYVGVGPQMFEVVT